jgi:dGTPase
VGAASQSVRERTEEIERQVLGERATLAADSKGREREEEPDPLRTSFQRDCDRLVHCKAFRRLKHKTQVFVSPEGDHYRVRLTHTLEVSQIARTIAKVLRLHEELTEAIALGHDLGHTPFGHAGERVIDALMPGGFNHYEQSLRIVDKLENNGQGLNLTWEVRDGIAKHTWSMPMPSTLEGQVARFADRIAYVNHDIDDAIRAGILRPEELPSDAVAVLGPSHEHRIDALVSDLVKESEKANEVTMSKPVLDALDRLRAFLFDRVYLRKDARSEQEKAIAVVRSLFAYYLDHPEAVPAEYLTTPGDLPTRIADYIAGMTDRFALRMYEQLFLPQSWLL